jgi:hypothetical protein
VECVARKEDLRCCARSDVAVVADEKEEKRRFERVPKSRGCGGKGRSLIRNCRLVLCSCSECENK